MVAGGCCCSWRLVCEPQTPSSSSSTPPPCCCSYSCCMAPRQQHLHKRILWTPVTPCCFGPSSHRLLTALPSLSATGTFSVSSCMQNDLEGALRCYNRPFLLLLLQLLLQQLVRLLLPRIGAPAGIFFAGERLNLLLVVRLQLLLLLLLHHLLWLPYLLPH